MKTLDKELWTRYIGIFEINQELAELYTKAFKEAEQLASMGLPWNKHNQQLREIQQFAKDNSKELYQLAMRLGMYNTPFKLN